jgi:hypothetical protein
LVQSIIFFTIYEWTVLIFAVFLLINVSADESQFNNKFSLKTTKSQTAGLSIFLKSTCTSLFIDGTFS